jgi:IS5 family transposase
VDAVIYRAKTGIPWRDLPERFGPWKSVYNLFASWSRKDAWADLFQALRIGVDDTSSIVDGTIVRAHQDASEKGDPMQCFGTLSRRFFDQDPRDRRRERALHVALTPGERHELIAAPELLDYAGDAVIGDTGYDSNEFRAELKARGIKAVISSKP